MKTMIMSFIAMLAVTSTITAHARAGIDYPVFTTPLADDYTGAAAASGIAGFVVLVTILLCIYSVISFLLPIFVYRIMRRNTASYDRLGEIRDLLRKQEFLNDQEQPQPQITTNQPQMKTIVAPPAKESVNIFSGEIVK
jgi:uncharacterized membrane protein